MSNNDRITIPEQTPRWITKSHEYKYEGGKNRKRCDYVYDRSQKILIAAYPENRNHFEGGCLYHNNVTITPCENTDTPLTGLWIEAPTSIALVRKRFELGDGFVDLDKLRNVITEYQQLYEEERLAWDAAEKTVSVYEVDLSPAEAKYLLTSERCSCGHLFAFHEEDGSYTHCVILGCRCSDH